MRSSLLFTLLSFIGASFASNGQSLYQFENGTWVDNIAVRANGNLLVTLIDRPELYEINPFERPTSAKLVYRFSEYVSLLGTIQVGPEVFTVVAGNFTRQTGPEPETWAVWKADFSGGEEAHVSEVADIPGAVFLDGMVALDPEAGTVLVGDAAEGVIFRLDTNTGEYALLQRDESFRPSADAALPVGLNGIRISENHLYYVNTFNPLYGRVPSNEPHVIIFTKYISTCEVARTQVPTY
ncbi:hypothetical protein ARSEF4850_006636 [Beauveria asiatica]